MPRRDLEGDFGAVRVRKPELSESYQKLSTERYVEPVQIGKKLAHVDVLSAEVLVCI